MKNAVEVFTFRPARLIERRSGRTRYRWENGWSWYNNGQETQPYMTQPEAQAWAKQQGGIAAFDHTPQK